MNTAKINPLLVCCRFAIQLFGKAFNRFDRRTTVTLNKIKNWPASAQKQPVLSLGFGEYSCSAYKSDYRADTVL